ncbi:MAG TPA: PD-(D/E)XK nuclease family transposase [Candidatus Eisenbergiella merdipullorum]|uniref:PD-(D/E)XK nuclease family transposase n=1 Tax=Candidatus Eisenbergiella merdipullorum TaxID=2838553 RepID=A0A9D2I484_9FIRM|nr:PD-(D/E)XK nuclease family transposase [Candidatus Eisenbergiella merdipullorum]
MKKLLSRLQEVPGAYSQFLEFPPRLQEEFLDFCTGQRGVKITYDPFFKFVFNPELHPERLEKMLSAIMKENVKIRQVLPPESIRFHEGMSLVVMDILVELSSGALCNVEIQKAPYAFPGPRAACYSSELVVRQYSRARRRAAAQKIPFSYHQLSKVYTIVILEKSSGEFSRYSDHYVHRASQVFDTGLSLNLLQEYIFISLDIFHNIAHDMKEELEAWLMFLSSDDPADIARIITAFPEFSEYYKDIAGFREKPEELISMFSRVLAEMDRDEYFCMMEELKENVKKLSEQARSLENANQSLANANQSLENVNQSLANANQSLENANQGLENANQDLENANQSLENANQSLEDANRSLAGKNRSLARKNRSLAGENRNLSDRISQLLEQRDRMAVWLYQKTGDADELARLLGMSEAELQAVLDKRKQ